MVDNLSQKRVANTLAVTFGIVSLICYILILITPAGSVSLFGSIFHGIDINKIAVDSVSISNGLLGVLEAIILGWVIGWLFAKVYNKMK